MSKTSADMPLAESYHSILSQPPSVLHLSGAERDRLIVSISKLGKEFVVASYYGDDIWWMSGVTTVTNKARTKIDFTSVPESFREVAKAILYRLLRKGREGQKRASASTLLRLFVEINNFFTYLKKHDVSSLSRMSPTICSSYLESVRASKGNKRLEAEQLVESTLYKRLSAVEVIYEVSQFTMDPMSARPWPGQSAEMLSRSTLEGYERHKKTPIIPDEIFVPLFQKAWHIVQNASRSLILTDEVEHTKVANREKGRTSLFEMQRATLTSLGWTAGLKELRSAHTEIRTACYIVIASLSGCRVHEIAFLQRGACFSTLDDKGEQYWWMRSKSTKTDEGVTEWMIPEAAVLALQVMERWAEPFQKQLQHEVDRYQAIDPNDIRISRAQEHLGALFLGYDRRGEKIQTLSLQTINDLLGDFIGSTGNHWRLTTHQFRRKFANYAARSKFGDLRYLKQHFKHWNMDMTLGYAMNESQEMALYLDIQEELDDTKESLVDTWLKDAEPLAGGYGKNLVNWRAREENIALFKTRKDMVRAIAHSTAIRSNGHAWCTADDNQCVGNDIERTRCGDDCINAVIGRQHEPLYRGLFEHLKELENCDDIGEGGRARVQRDLARCASVLASLTK